MNVRILDGEREGSSVYHCGDGFHYHYNNGNNYGENEGNASVLYMRCSNLHTKNCHGTAKVLLTPEGTEWINLARHTCCKDVYYERVRRLRRYMLQEATRANGPYETPTSLVERIRNRFVHFLVGYIHHQ